MPGTDTAGKTVFIESSATLVQAHSGVAATEEIGTVVGSTSRDTAPIKASGSVAMASPVEAIGEESRALLRLLDPARSVDASRARQELSSLIAEVGRTFGSVLITKYGKPEAALIAYPTMNRVGRLVYRVADAYARRALSTAEMSELPRDLITAIREG